MKVQKLFRRTQFGIFLLFGSIALSTSALCVYTVDTHLSKEYESNSKAIAQVIADASVDIMLNRDLSALQSLVDQFLQIQGIKYIYITDESGEFVAHTFVPGIPAEIRAGNPHDMTPIERSLPGMGDFVEVGSPILAGVAGAVHVGMDTSLVALKIQQAIGQQAYLISSIFVLGVFATVWFVNLAAKPLGQLLAYAVHLASGIGRGEESEPGAEFGALLERDDESGQLARLFQYFSRTADPEKLQRDPTPGGGSW